MPARRFFVLAAQKTLRAILYKVRTAKGLYIEVSVVFVSQREIQRLNKRYRGKNKPTDVLSFPRFSSVSSRAGLHHLGKIVPMADPDGVIRLGEIIIVPEVARKEALSFGHGAREQYLFLFVHGLLHLLGYNHENSKRDDIFMRQTQQNVLKLFS